MDSEKRNPWRSARDFLKEYLIIVIGVLTALGAGQVVENLNWADRTQKTQAHLRAELTNATIGAQAQIAQEQCEYDILERLRIALLQPGDDWTPPVVAVRPNGVPYAVIAGPITDYLTEGWRDAQADGTANHFTADEQLRFGAAYGLLEHGRQANDAQHADMAELNSLAWARKLDPQSRTQYLRLISRLNEEVRTMAVNGRQLLDETRGLGIKPGRLEDYGPALKVYQEACRQFYAGEREIRVVNAPAKGA